MAAALIAGCAGSAVLLRAPGESAFLGLYGVIAVTVAVVARTLRRRRPPAAWGWWCLAVGVALVGLGTAALGLFAEAMATQPNWFLVPGLLWVGSYLGIIVGEAGIVASHWGRRPDRAILVDGLVVSIAVMVPTFALAGSVYALTPGPLVVRLTTASFVVLDGVVGAMLAQLLLNGDRRNPSLWCMVAAVGIPVAANFAAILLRASVDVRYLAVGWVASYVLLQWTMLSDSLPRLTAPAPSTRVRLDGTRSVILALALFTVPMTVVLGGRDAGPVATACLLGAAAVVAMLVLLRLTWLFRDSERAHAAVKARERYFRALVQNIGDVILVADLDGRVQYRSPSAARLFGFAEDALVEQQVCDLLRADDRGAAADLFDEALRKPGEIVSGEVLSRHRDGSLLWLEVMVHDLTGDPDVGNVVIACRDTTQRRVLEDQLRQEARHDALTSLPNRVLAFERLDRLMRRAAGAGMEVGVMFIDLDNFKGINDNLGHAVGDEVLCAVAERLMAAVRPHDTVARLGGDEFVVLAEMPNGQGFDELAKRLVASLSVPLVLDGREVLVTASVGVALSLPGEVGEDVLRRADVALYRAKRAGRNAYVVFQAGDHGVAGDDFDLALDLRRALDEGDQLCIHFQPIIELGSTRVSGVEALVRWQHPTRGLLLPDSFVPLAEENGLIVPLGKWVLEEACRQVAATGIADLGVAVNVSARQLEDETLRDDILAALSVSGLSASRLTLELTETVVMHDGQMPTRLAGLKELGIQLALDDFGTGYSSLAYLQQFPIDTLKVDRQFMAAVATDEQAAALVQGVITLAHGVGLHTVAEGIEDSTQAELLREAGCESAQGFFFARPAPLSELLESFGLAAATERGRGRLAEPLVAASAVTRSGR